MTDQGPATLGTAAHTPGPWAVRHGVCRNDHPDTSPDVYGPQGQFVANCGCHEQANANARLIAAAPALAEEIERLKAENASLMESLRAAESGDGLQAFLTAAEQRAEAAEKESRAQAILFDRHRLASQKLEHELRAALAAAEQRNTELEGALRGLTTLLLSATTIQCPGCDRPVSVEWGPHDLRMIAPHVKHGVHGYVDPCPSSRTIILRARAALHDEERSAPGETNEG